MPQQQKKSGKGNHRARDSRRRRKYNTSADIRNKERRMAKEARKAEKKLRKLVRRGDVKFGSKRYERLANHIANLRAGKGSVPREPSAFRRRLAEIDKRADALISVVERQDVEHISDPSFLRKVEKRLDDIVVLSVKTGSLSVFDRLKRRIDDIERRKIQDAEKAKEKADMAADTESEMDEIPAATKTTDEADKAKKAKRSEAAKKAAATRAANKAKKAAEAKTDEPTEDETVKECCRMVSERDDTV